nr:glycosyltransferase family 2 protein [Candidatus Freyarchaeota archaeon]
MVESSKPRKKVKANPRVSIIIVHFNGVEVLDRCLKFLSKIDYDNYEVILVDNASTDNSVEFVRDNYPWVRIVENERNLAFAEGNNRGLRYATGEYIVLLNNDTEVTPNWLRELVRLAESDPSIGICGSKILDMENRNIIQVVGALCDIYGATINQGIGEEDNNQYDTVSDTFFVCGASLLIKREVVEKIGLFDPKFFFLAEDVDLCWRAHLAGYRVVVNPFSVLYHKGGYSLPSTKVSEIATSGRGGDRYRTSAKRRYFAERNTLRAVLKNYSSSSLVKIVPRLLAIYFAETELYLLSGRFKVARQMISALLWNIKNLRDTWRLHESIQSIRERSDKEIQKKMLKRSAKIQMFTKMGVPQFE